MFLLWCFIVAAGTWGVQRQYGLQAFSALTSQAALIPGLIAYLLWIGRSKIFAAPSFSLSRAIKVGIASMMVAAVGAYCVHRGALYLASIFVFLCVVLLVSAGFTALFGTEALWHAKFPFSMFLLMIPLPNLVIDNVVSLLQMQSAWLASVLLSLTGTPVYREGILIFVPGITIEVARECSGINSSIALLITSIVVARSTLYQNWRRITLVLLCIPFSIIKNAARIATLTLLAVRVDPRFLTGSLHRQGGFVFYLLTLVFMYPIWKTLEKGDAEPHHQAVSYLAAQPGEILDESKELSKART